MVVQNFSKSVPRHHFKRKILYLIFLYGHYPLMGMRRGFMNLRLILKSYMSLVSFRIFLLIIFLKSWFRNTKFCRKFHRLLVTVTRICFFYLPGISVNRRRSYPLMYCLAKLWCVKSGVLFSQAFFCVGTNGCIKLLRWSKKLINFISMRNWSK